LKKKEPALSSTTISVVILTLNEEATIDRCPNSITRQSFPKSEIEIVVVDGNSTDRTREIAELYTPKILLENRHTFGYARNLGVSSAKGKYVAFISADAWAELDWLTNIKETLTSQGVVGVVGKQVPITSPNWVSKIRSTGFRKTYRGKSRWMERGDNFSTVNCAYSREVILKNGGFDESLPACEDQDLGHRILQTSLKILYDPNVTVHHDAEESLRDIWRKTFQQGVGEGICNSRYQVWSERLLLSILLLLTVLISPSVLVFAFPEVIRRLVFGPLLFILLLALTRSALEVLRETRDWKAFLGAYIYYPSVAIVESMGFLVGRLTSNRYPTNRFSDVIK
jgi:glycosyltransferase involved in cell wall biosynthesis